MKRVAAPTQPVITLIVALFFVVAFGLAGCSAGTISGPDLPTAERVLDSEVQPLAPIAPVAPHNEGIESSDAHQGGGSVVVTNTHRESRN